MRGKSEAQSFRFLFVVGGRARGREGGVWFGRERDPRGRFSGRKGESVCVSMRSELGGKPRGLKSNERSRPQERVALRNERERGGEREADARLNQSPA